MEIKALPKAQGDSAMLRQVWVNLLGNAVKFTNSRATANIEIGAAAAGGDCTFYVKDNGVGLAIVKRIIARHGGRVWAEGKVNEGATICFTLPIKES